MGETIFQASLLEESYIALSCLKLLETFLNIKVLGKNHLCLLYVSKDLRKRGLRGKYNKSNSPISQSQCMKSELFSHVRLP